MTNPKNWPNPERPGVPMFPERDGLHVVLGPFDATPTLVLWRFHSNTYHQQGIVFTPEEMLGARITYCGPHLTPVQIAELLAGERERCAKECERLKPSMDEIIGNSFFGVRGVALVDAASAIRNLGAAP